MPITEPGLVDRFFHTLGTLVALAWAMHLMVHMHDISQQTSNIQPE